MDLGGVPVYVDLVRGWVGTVELGWVWCSLANACLGRPFNCWDDRLNIRMTNVRQSEVENCCLTLRCFNICKLSLEVQMTNFSFAKPVAQ